MEDIELYDAEKGKKCGLNNMGVIEDLAIIEYMFCDKTGTLTKNQLKFREISLVES